MTPTISVVTPFLNAEAHLTEAIASVRAQTFGGWELLLVDDGSTDRSPVIAAAAAAADPRIRLLATAPDAARGAAAARNAGLRAARGGFIAFLDADDLFEPDKLCAELDLLRAHPEAAMVYSPTRWWHPGAEHLDWVERMGRSAGRLHRPPTVLNRVLLMQQGQVPCTCAVLIRREAIAEVGGFEEAFRLYEDQTLWAKILIRFPAYVAARPVARYRQHPASVSALSERAGEYTRLHPHGARIAFLAWVRDHAEATGLMQPSIERALRLALAPYPGHRLPLTLGDRITLGGLALKKGLRATAQRGRRLIQRFRVQDAARPRSLKFVSGARPP